MRFLLDADTASDVIKCWPSALALANEYKGEWAISSIVYQELTLGLIGSKGTRTEEGFAKFLRQVEVLPFGKAEALAAADIANSLRKQGINIGLHDEQIAGHAAALDLTLVTNNSRHFEQIAGLSIACWR